MFDSCNALETIPLFNTAAVTNMASMFQSCFSLKSVPALVTTAVTSAGNFSSMFNLCTSLSRIQAKDFRFSFSISSCKLSATALNEIYTNLPTVTGQQITVSFNYGTASDNPAIATAKGWTVTG
jgi:surface protein